MRLSQDLLAVDDISKTLGSGIRFTLAFQEVSRFLASDSAPVYLVLTTLSHNKGWGNRHGSGPQKTPGKGREYLSHSSLIQGRHGGGG